ncbi:PREDICTED: pentatricopeptide [Prunus dulcis]|uniref:PREDICTED: pentatricopeptide n=1 Tax=Prunus dulcis TaxID=3755 RepID=A0A5E4F1K4_PRUDU|nr:hypothetical protein L3X38_009131 [Prunus dulcis]VVA21310.1 PREDICTED: pentatricopeptide [Prunus dulcis]
MNLLRELLTQCLQPSACSYTPLIKGLCQVGAAQEAKTLWTYMKNRDLEPSVGTHDDIIIGLCDQGDAADGFKWLIEMLKSYALEKGICCSLVNKLCGESNHFVETCLGEILEGK